MSDARNPRYKPVDAEWVKQIVTDKMQPAQIGAVTLQNAVDEVEFTICNYINRGYVPMPLKYVFVNLVMDLLKSDMINEGEIPLGDVPIGSIASIKDGDSQITFTSSKTVKGVHVADVDALLYNYKLQLNKFRVLKW